MNETVAELGMIQAGLQFRSSDKEQLVQALLTLPHALRPTRKAYEEDETGEEIADSRDVVRAAMASEFGFFLKGSRVIYNLRFAGSDKPIFCDCFLEIDAASARSLLAHMASAHPRFGFACAPEERRSRNRVIARVGANTVESWVGRDIEKYVPGFYWLTLLSTELIERHAVPLLQLERAALEHVKFETGEHLFRFYEFPEDWQNAVHVKALCTLPGVFNAEVVRQEILSARSFVELDGILRIWK